MNGPVGGVRLHEGGLEGEAHPAARGARASSSLGVADRDVDAGQPLVELVAGRHLARHEAEVAQDALRRSPPPGARGPAGPASRRRGSGPRLERSSRSSGGASRFRISVTSASRADRCWGSPCIMVGPLLGRTSRTDRNRPSRGKSSRASGWYNPPGSTCGATAMRLEISHEGGTTHEVDLARGVVVLGRDPGVRRRPQRPEVLAPPRGGGGGRPRASSSATRAAPTASP